MKKKINKSAIFLALLGAVLVAIVGFVLITSNKTVIAYVPATAMKAGDVVEATSLSAINVPANTPAGFLRDKNQIIGYRLKNSVAPNQFLYPGDFLSSWESYGDQDDIPEDFIITTIQVDDGYASGGIITAGDYVDVFGIHGGGEGVDINGIEGIGSQLTYVLSNVKVLNTNSNLSQMQGGESADMVESMGTYYVVALSYDDMKKIRSAETGMQLWLNLVPKQNEENPPLLEQMMGDPISGLHDARYPVQDKDGKIIEDYDEYFNNTDINYGDLTGNDVEVPEDEEDND